MLMYVSPCETWLHVMSQTYLLFLYTDLVWGLLNFRSSISPWAKFSILPKYLLHSLNRKRVFWRCWNIREKRNGGNRVSNPRPWCWGWHVQCELDQYNGSWYLCEQEARTLAALVLTIWDISALQLEYVCLFVCLDFIFHFFTYAYTYNIESGYQTERYVTAL